MVKYSSHPSRTRDLVMPMQTKDFVKQNIPVLQRYPYYLLLNKKIF